MTASDARRSRFGRFELQLDERRLLADGEPVEIGKRALDVLAFLVEQRGGLATKDALLQRAWGRAIVVENALHAQISALRKILGRDAIETVASFGYRLALEVVADPSPNPPRHNLPRQLTSFIGRDAELGNLARLAKEWRLVTLTGVGGCGKTRLAIEAAARMVDDWADGAWLAELDPIVDPALVPQATASALGLRERKGEALVDTVIAHLADKQALILLDNAEHVVRSVASLVHRLLLECPGVAILVTSRERLGIPGEKIFQVPPLATPEPEHSEVSGDVTAVGSVRLFVDRVRLQNPDFTLTPSNVRTVVSLCRRLDGIPLAIELAASRARAMTVEEIERHLDQRRGLLVNGARVVPPRQRSLRSLLDWSYDLLTQPEQALFRRCGPFAGGFSLAAAEEVGKGGVIEREDVLDLVTSLVDKSLLQADTRAGEARYRMLALVRDYANQRLVEANECDAARRSHTAHFCALAETAETHLQSVSHTALAERLEREHDNIRMALSWSLLPEGDLQGGLALGAAMRPFWGARGYLSEGRDWLERLLAATAASGNDAMRLKALLGASVLAWMQGDYQRARETAVEGLVSSREGSDIVLTANMLNILAIVESDLGNYEVARTCYEDGLALLKEAGLRKKMGSIYNNFGNVCRDMGDVDRARAMHEEALALRREFGDDAGVASSLVNLSVLARDCQDYEAVSTMCEEALSIWHALGDKRCISTVKGLLGACAADHGDYLGAVTMLRDSLESAAAVGDRHGVVESLGALAHAVSIKPDILRAALFWGTVERLREELGTPRKPPDVARYHGEVTAAREALRDDDAFARAWQAGRSMKFDDALRDALTEE